LPTNTRLGWKGLPGTNTSLLRKSVNYGRNKFYSTGPWCTVDLLLRIFEIMTVKIFYFLFALSFGLKFKSNTENCKKYIFYYKHSSFK
jgi:hypothetical protein